MPTFTPVKIITIKEAIDEYLHEKRVTGALSDTSVYNRRYELNRFDSFCASHQVVNVTQIHKNLIIYYLNK